MRLEDGYSEEEYLKLLLASYRDVFSEDPALTADLIRADIRSFEEVENYEICARLKKILDRLE